MQTSVSTKHGVIFALVAFTFWGLSPIYFKALLHVPPTEILAHRVMWSVVFLFLILYLKKHFRSVKEIFINKKILYFLIISSLLVSLNWLTFIWAVNNDMLLEVSLGYYITPLVNIFLGFVFLKEKSSPMQILAILLAILAVSIQIFSLGSLPFVSLILAFSFAFYGLTRKKANVSSIPGLYIETLMIFPLAFGYFTHLLFINESNLSLTFDTPTSWLLLLAGPVTIFPLLCFNSAATRLKLSTIGYFQYIGPSVNLILAIFIYNEPISQEKLMTFALIWTGLFLVGIEPLRKK